MAVLALTDATVWVGGYDLSSDLNSVTLNATADELDATTFGGTYRTRVGGLRSVELSHQGFVQYADPDSTLFADLAAERVFTVTPTGDDGEVAYIFKAVRTAYTPLSGAVGDLAGFQGTAMGSDGVGMPRGRLLKAKGAVSGAVSGTARQLGAVSATQKVYTTIHVFTAGTTADVIVESDDGSGFATGTTRSTTTVTAAGATWVAPVSGAITDDWWRVRFANVTGSFSLAVAVAIA